MQDGNGVTMSPDARPDDRPIVLITGAAGAIGSSLAKVLEPDYRVVGLDLEGMKAPVDCIAIDLTNDDSVELALRKFSERYGETIASVVHLAAYLDFTGEDHPLYEKANVEGTRRLLSQRQAFEVGQFVYSGSMLVHEAGKPGERISEDTPIQPIWAYPKSKAAAEEVIRETSGDFSYVLLHLDNLNDDQTAVPTLSRQIGALVLTVTVAAFAEMARPLRFLNMAFGLALMITPFAYGAPGSPPSPALPLALR